MIHHLAAALFLQIGFEASRPDEIQLSPRYTFDSLNRLRSLREESGATRWIVRDVAGRAQAETTLNWLGSVQSTRIHHNDGHRRIATDQVSGSKRFLYGRGLDELLFQEKGGAQLSPVVSQLGSTMKLLAASGAVVDQFRYDAFGSPLSGNTNSFSHLFAGAIYDAKSKLYDLRHRHYDPKIGRFLSRDPLGTHADPFNAGNGYAYVGNNPLNRRDPLGLLTGDEKTPPAPQFQFSVARMSSVGTTYYTPLPSSQPKPEPLPYKGPYSNMGSPIPPGEPMSAAETMDGIQLGLDAAGMTEPFGALADGANTVISLFRGQWLDAGLSGLSAIPLLGWISGGTKLARKADNAIEAAAEGPGLAKCRDPHSSGASGGNDPWNRSQPGKDRMPQDPTPGDASGSGGGSGKGPGKGGGADFPIDPDEVDRLLGDLHNQYREIERMQGEFSKQFPDLASQLQKEIPLERLKQEIIDVVGNSDPKASHDAYLALVALLGKAKHLAHQTQKKTSFPLN